MTGPRAAGRRWTPDEMMQLEEMMNAGKTAPEMSRMLKRSTQAIYSRVQLIQRTRAHIKDGLKAEK